MSNRLRILLVTSLVFNLAFVAAFAVRRTRWHHGPPRAPFQGGRDYVRTLGLRPEQVAPMQALDDSLRRDMRDLGSRMGAERARLETLLQQPQPDRAAVERQLDAVAGLQRAMLARLADQEFRVRAVLTPEQLQRFHSLFRSRRPHGDRGFGPQGGPGGDRGFGPRDGFRP